MPVIETTLHIGENEKEICDLCGESPENNVLFEKPQRVIVNKQLYINIHPEPLFVCLDCLQAEAENF